MDAARRRAMSSDPELDRLIGRKPRKNRLGCIGWLLFLVVAVAAALAIKYLYLPMRKGAAELATKIADSEGKLKDLEGKLAEAKDAQNKTAGERDQLSSERQKAVEEKERAVKELEDLKGDLTKDLGAEVQSGDIKIQ